MSERFDIRAYLEARLPRARIVADEKRHGELTANCPSCSKYGSFYVNTTNGAYVCFKCDLRGRNIAGLIAFLDDITHDEAVAFILRRSVKLRRRETILTLKERLRLLRPHADDDEIEEAAKYVDDPLPEGFIPCYNEETKVWSLPPYLKTRGLKSATIRAWKMGYCVRGWVPSKEQSFKRRLIIPVECPNGSSYTARDMTGEQEPKYLNPKGTDFRRLLIGWNVARFTGDLVLCEGPLDAVMLWQHGLNALALGGKELHKEQMALLMGLPSDTSVTIMLDPEEEVASFKVADVLCSHFSNIYIAHLRPLVDVPERKKMDPGCSLKDEAWSANDNAKKWTGSRLGRLAAKLRASRRSVAV